MMPDFPNSKPRAEQPASSVIAPIVPGCSAECTGAPVLVFTSGCFDLFHAGHLELLRQAKSLGDRLVVGVNSDASVRQLKGEGRPIIPQHERARIVAACRYVDEVYLFEETTPCNLVRRLHPSVIAKGPGYSEANMPEATLVQQYGGRIVILSGPPISTSILMERIRHHA